MRGRSSPVILLLACALVIAACGSSSNSHSSKASGSSQRTSVPSPAVSSPAASTAAGEAGPPGGPVPRGSRATSVTFISPSTAFVLGTAPCGHPPCSEILRTRNRGQTWQGLPAPLEGVSGYYGNGLWGLRFADAEHGYAFGNGLWQTTNGGASWQRGGAPAPLVLALEVARDRELIAVGARCVPGQGGCSTELTLFHRPLMSGPWTAVASARSYLPASIAVHGSVVWVALGQMLYVSSNAGLAFVAERSACAAPSLNNGTFVSDDGTHAYMLCTGGAGAGSFQKYVYDSTGPGSGWTRAGTPPLGGAPEGLSAGSDNAVMVAAASGASLLYRSTDGGRTWRTALTEDDGGVGWADLGFTTAADGVVIHGPASTDRSAAWRGQLLLTDNGGLSWHAVSF